MFRKLYWVTEHLQENGTSKVAGIFTSIPDLMRIGLATETPIRLTLAKLDSPSAPFGTWIGPEYDGLEAKLEEFIQTDEFSREHCQALMKALRSPIAA